MLHVAKKDPVVPASKGRIPLLIPRVEPPVSVTTPVSQLHQSQKRPHHQRNSPLCQDQDHWHPLAFPCCGQTSLTHYHQSRQTGPWAYPWEPNYILPPWGPYRWPYHIFQSLVRYNESTSPELLPCHPWPRCLCNWPSPNPWINFDSEEELWANATLFTWPTSNYTAPRILGSDQKCVVSLFMSMIGKNKHDEASLIIEWSDVAQHMHVHLLSH